MPNVFCPFFSRSAEVARDGTRYTHLLTNSFIMAMVRQVSTRRFTRETSVVVHIEARVFCCDVLANAVAQLHSAHGDTGVVNTCVLNLCRLKVDDGTLDLDVRRLLLLIVVHVHGNSILSELLWLGGRGGRNAADKEDRREFAHACH